MDKNNPELKAPISEATKELFETGKIVGEYAQRLFPDGVHTNFNHGNIEQGILVTQRLISERKTIFEAAFLYDECLTVIDILDYTENGWNAYEVKSTTKIKDEHKVDASYQYYVIMKSGLKLNDFSMIRLNNQYSRNGEIDLRELFVAESALADICGQQDFVASEIIKFKNSLNSTTCPTRTIGRHCEEPHKCDYKSHCWSGIPEDSVFDISRLTEEKKISFYSRGIIKAKDVPEDGLTATQKIHVNSAKLNRDYINKEEIRSFLSGLVYPLYFLDFESIKSAIPLFDKTKPHQQITFQYSLHIQSSKNSETQHSEFLSEHRNDPREDFITKLILELGTSGSIVVYNLAFEKTRLNEIAKDFPSFKQNIDGLISRLVDLVIPFRGKHFYKPAMKGSYSIKDVLPAMVPTMSYQNLAVNNGTAASNSFLKFIKDGLPTEQYIEFRKNLLEYCKLDTFAMVKILEVLYEEFDKANLTT
ncbi:MAG: DUF2779 domain-containing protein [Bacteroidetes bacterium]|nr:DUF2779 domain-containing protein [Bacteroidota bacterium]